MSINVSAPLDHTNARGTIDLADRAGQFGRFILNGAKTFRHNISRRRKLRGYLDLDQRMLDDIGITRAEINWALQLPLHVNGALELERVAKARRKVQRRK